MTKPSNHNLPLPSFYNSQHAAESAFRPDQQAIFELAAEWRKKHNIKFAGADTYDLHLLGIDLQKDFCFPDGSLYVGGRDGQGAIDDNRRIAEFVYGNLDKIKNFTVTMDTHFAYQIFFASFWTDSDGQALAPHTEITVEMIRSGSVQPNPAIAWWVCNGNYPWLLKQVEFYCDELEKAGKYKLYLWPPHAIIGSDGHALAGVVHECRLFHNFVRGVQSWTEIKGGNPLTENYSVLRPEVQMRHDGQPLAQKNTRFIKTLFAADALAIVGQAASHCVKSTIDDLLDEIIAQDPALVKKVYILSDCMSSVTVPDGQGGFIADFTPQCEEALQRFADAGMNIVNSTDAIADWPGITLKP